MKHIWSKKIVKFLHFTIVWYKRIFVALLVLVLGTALLHIYSLIQIVRDAAMVVQNKASIIIMILSIIFAVPTISYIVEKGLSAYIEDK